MALFLNESSPRKSFKDLLGNANHLLITILVGLSAVERGLIKECPPELRAAWNPRDQKASAERSRVMTLETTLVRSTDALDAYISLARRRPFLIQDQAEQAALDACGQSIMKKFRKIKSEHPSSQTITALLEVMIVWRNKSVHSLSDDTLDNEIWKILHDDKEWIRTEFRGMNVDRLFSDFSNGGPPSFKETASFIRATQEFVQAVDDDLLTKLKGEDFLRDLIWGATEVKNDKNNLGRRKRIQSIWGRDASDRPHRVKQFLKNQGLSDVGRTDGPFATFDDTILDRISAMTPLSIFDYIKPIEVGA